MEVLIEGTFLICRQQQVQTVSLYHLGPFFCEVYVDAETNEILSFRYGLAITVLPFTLRPA